MKSDQILQQTDHRPFQYPKREWKFYQEWNKAVFLHWKVNPEEIMPFLPNGMKPDTINGKTWVSLVAFTMNNIGIRNLPKVPYISDFFEINIRVYITYNDKPSVYFLNMESSKRSSCNILKVISKFPYQYSKMSRNDGVYTSKNKVFNDSFNMEYSLEDTSIKKDETDLWLTERYAVFQDYKNHIIEYDVHHVEWPMQSISINKLNLNYPRFSHLINNQPDKTHYSSGVQVLTWDKRKL
ncbi:YqjF family protein [Flavivirga eckloniae]|uniref:DUF2071 domain-containing protein n=1 Tax=Flavivirga eckloniae TaxID=1803846 RepID=A0A2K9PRE7_9FLAO|nr:DUF2071 domain-containing protein [Flavivirga eckloniae]AUP79634.1 hypothetical protein C1H87_13320 [Flavivirga eckloniae]